MSDLVLRQRNVPEIKAERCVHNIINCASCQRCADICHLDAWQLDTQNFGINAALCDDCGICAAVCPQGVIEHVHHLLSIRWRSEQIALIACEKASELIAKESDGAEEPGGIISCIHALGMNELASLHEAGHRKLLITTAACHDCERGTNPLLDKHLQSLNSLLKQRNKPLLTRINIHPTQWLNIILSADPQHIGVAISRRHFLRKATRKVSEYSLPQLKLNTTKQENPSPLAKLLFTSPEQHPFPYVPEIDISRCSACDTCTKLCPHQALTVDITDDAFFYKIEAVNCTACGICEDVCEDNAIIIKQNTSSSQKAIPLTQGRCQLCNVSFHTLDTKPTLFCLICAKKSHQNLFQILD